MLVKRIGFHAASLVTYGSFGIYDNDSRVALAPAAVYTFSLQSFYLIWPKQLEPIRSAFCILVLLVLLEDNTLFCEPSQAFNFFSSRLFGSPLPFINSDTLKGMRSLNACIGANFVGGENLYEEREKPEIGCISDQRGSASSDASFRFCVHFVKLDSPETSRLSEIRQPQEQPRNSEYTTTTVEAARSCERFGRSAKTRGRVRAVASLTRLVHRGSKQRVWKRVRVDRRCL